MIVDIYLLQFTDITFTAKLVKIRSLISDVENYNQKTFYT